MRVSRAPGSEWMAPNGWKMLLIRATPAGTLNLPLQGSAQPLNLRHQSWLAIFKAQLVRCRAHVVSSLEAVTEEP
ncbi:Uncharacterized protein HZ326_17166 [Fusarium oxysporum f. sp. albedinis]|nr:Uncharacterized protein HZ326_17166 [Fusarium oxysporum f. sp. albedinis]